MSDALAAGLIELGLPTSEGAALGLIASGWARGPSHRPRIMTAEKHIEAQLRLLMPRSHLDANSRFSRRRAPLEELTRSIAGALCDVKTALCLSLLEGFAASPGSHLRSESGIGSPEKHKRV